MFTVLRHYVGFEMRKIIITVAIATLFMILLVSCAPLQVSQTTDVTEQITVAPINTINPYPAPSEIVSTPDLTETEPPVPLETIIARATTAIFEFTSSPYPTSLPGETGIHESDAYINAEMLKIGVQVENLWGGELDGNKVNVFVGALASDSTQGVVYVIYIYPYRTWKIQFIANEKHGPLTITAEQNRRLELLAPDGTISYFDIPALTFVSSLTEVISTATPSPTYTPIILPPPTPTFSGYPQPVTAMPTLASP